LPQGRLIEPGHSRELDLPAKFRIGETHLDFAWSPGVPRETLGTISLPVLAATASGEQVTLPTGPDAAALAEWFEGMIAAQRAPAGAPDSPEQTARALTNLIGLDRGLFLARDPETDDWRVVASAPEAPAPGRPEFSRSILRYVTQERRTFIHNGPATDSL